MTGFCTKNITLTTPQGERVECTLLLKSLNGKLFEISCKFPFVLMHLEHEIIKKLKAKLVRGSVYMVAQISNPASLKTAVVFSPQIVEQYIGILSDLKKRYDLQGQLTVSDLIHLPNIFSFHEEFVDHEVAATVLKAIDELADQMMAVRAQEGAQLEVDLLQRLAAIKTLFAEVETRAVDVIKMRREQLLENAQTLIAQQSSEARDSQLAALQVQLNRFEVNEEIVRFKTHGESLAKTIADKATEKGKKIDFLLQELFREINTLTAKANDAAISTLAISIKIELEKAREQAQNVL
jgi:uncharacterized protein (TIGR00255 family)